MDTRAAKKRICRRYCSRCRSERLVGSSKCSYCIAVEVLESLVVDPSRPTDYPPGSLEKIAVMASRFANGIPLQLPGDVGHDRRVLMLRY